MRAYHVGMAPDVAEVQRAWLALAPDDRADVIHSGLLSLDEASVEPTRSRSTPRGAQSSRVASTTPTAAEWRSSAARGPRLGSAPSWPSDTVDPRVRRASGRDPRASGRHPVTTTASVLDSVTTWRPGSAPAYRTRSTHPTHGPRSPTGTRGHSCEAGRRTSTRTASSTTSITAESSSPMPTRSVALATGSAG